MFLEKGSDKNPTGNLILYCYVKGENPFHPGYDVIASNVVVSFLKVNDNYPVVTFPPVSFKSINGLKSIVAEYGNIHDIVKLPDFIMPEGKDEGNRYIQERMEQYNSFVMRYVELCRNKEKKTELVDDGVEAYLNALAGLSLEYRESKGLAKEAAKMKVDQLIFNFSTKYPQFDLENYKNAVLYPGKRGEELASLYIQKFNAISIENYEVASQIKKQIDKLESFPL